MANHSRVLVTGDAGFTGRRVVCALLTAGREVTGADLSAFPGPKARTAASGGCDSAAQVTRA